MGEMRVHRGGLTLRGVMEADWGSLTDVEVADGLVWIHERGRQQPVTVSLGSANAKRQAARSWASCQLASAAAG